MRRGQLAQASRTRAEAAKHLLNKSQQIAAYLGHVSLECALKARILRQANVDTRSDLEKRLGPEYVNKLFSSKQGHALDFLSAQASLSRLLEVEHKPRLLESAEWKRMIDPNRPYSLRYGTESLSQEHARREVEIADEIGELIRRST